MSLALLMGYLALLSTSFISLIELVNESVNESVNEGIGLSICTDHAISNPCEISLGIDAKLQSFFAKNLSAVGLSAMATSKKKHGFSYAKSSKLCSRSPDSAPHSHA